MTPRLVSVLLLAAACADPVEDVPQAADSADLARTKDAGGVNGWFDYCDGAVLCAGGEGDCDSDAQCEAGLSCIDSFGSSFGLHWSIDVCAPGHCDNGVQDVDETGIDFGGSCGTICGGTNGDQEGYCTPGCPCDLGEGDCDSDDECAAGLTCVLDQGARFGLDPRHDVCLGTYGVTDLVAGDLVIAEIMINPNGAADSSAEWFEVYNASGNDVNLNGLVVKDATGAQQFTVTTSPVIAAGDYFVFVRTNNFALNGGIVGDFDYVNTFALTDTVDTIKLEDGTGFQLDIVKWTATWPLPVGKSIVFDRAVQVVDGDNNVAGNWCESGPTPVLASGDKASPGVQNRICPP